MKKNRRRYLLLLFVGVIFAFGTFATRLSLVMGTGMANGVNVSEFLAELYKNNSILQSKRGGIYTHDGEVIAVDATSYKLVAVLTDKWSTETDIRYVQDKEKTAEVLSQYIAIGKDEALAILNQPGVDQVEFGLAGSNLTYEMKKNIEAHELTGIEFHENPDRLYPNGVFASHIIGQTQQTDEGIEAGTSGIEYALDKELQGSDGYLQSERDSRGYMINGTNPEVIEPQDGPDVYLTLDKNLQIYLEGVVSEVQAEVEAEAITVTLVEAETGKVRAATQRPTFNAETKEGIGDIWQNLHVEIPFEPGSTLKVLTLAAALNEEAFHAEEYFLSGSILVNGIRINDHVPEGWGRINFIEGLARSSNVATVMMAEEMGFDRWKDYLDAFGIGNGTASLFANEHSGSNPYDTKVQAATTSFGQGLSVTPIQMIQAFTAVANDGKMMSPQFVEKIVNLDGSEKVVEPQIAGYPISETSAQEAMRYLTLATYDENSTTTGYHMEGYEMAIKTGTSQIVDSNNGGYLKGSNDYIYSVVGFAPASDPKFILYVTVQQPKLSDVYTYGGQPVQEIYKPVMKRALDSIGQGQLDTAVNNQAMPRLTDQSTAEVVGKLNEQGYDVAVIGEGERVVQQYPAAQEAFVSGQKIVIITSGEMTMPDLQGWSKNDALKVSDMTGIPFEFSGTGFITSQSVVSNTPLTEIAGVKFNLSPSVP